MLCGRVCTSARNVVIATVHDGESSGAVCFEECGICPELTSPGMACEHVTTAVAVPGLCGFRVAAEKRLQRVLMDDM